MIHIMRSSLSGESAVVVSYSGCQVDEDFPTAFLLLKPVESTSSFTSHSSGFRKLHVPFSVTPQASQYIQRKIID